MNLKKTRKLGVCCAMRCKDLATVIVSNEVWLCEKHASKIALEQDATAPAPTEAPGVDVQTELAEAPAPAEAPSTDAMAEPAPAKEGPLARVEVNIPRDESMRLEETKRGAEADLAELQTFSITSAQDQQFAEQEIKRLRDQWRFFEDKRKEATKPLNQALRAINHWFRPVQYAIRDLDAAWQQKLVAWRSAQVEQKQALLAVAQAKAKSQAPPAEIREALVQAQDCDPASDDMQYVDNWKYRVDDESLIPREFLCPDHAKLSAYAKEYKDKAQVPGVWFFNKPILRRK